MMSDDEKWHVYPSGLTIKGSNGPRIVDGVDTMTGEPAGGQPPTPEEVEEAEARSREHRRQRARSIFTDPVWPADRVVSWIGYRDIEAIEEPFAPAHYKDSRPVVEGMPRIALLRALQEGRLRAIRQQGKFVDRIHPDEWAFVQRAWSIDCWHECLFARSDIVALWPEVKASVMLEAEGEVAEAPTPAVVPENAMLSEPSPKPRERPERSTSEQSVNIVLEIHGDSNRELPPMNSLAREGTTSARRSRAREADIRGILERLPTDPPLSTDNVILMVREELAKLGKETVVREIKKHLDHYPARRRRGENAATLASRKLSKSDRNKSNKK